MTPEAVAVRSPAFYYMPRDRVDWLAAIHVGDTVRITRDGDDSALCYPYPSRKYEYPWAWWAKIAQISQRQIVTKGRRRFRRSDGEEIGSTYEDAPFRIEPAYTTQPPQGQGRWEP